MLIKRNMEEAFSKIYQASQIKKMSNKANKLTKLYKKINI